MTQSQISQAKQRIIWWDRAMFILFILSQIAITTLIYQHDSQGGLTSFAIVTTVVKSIVSSVITIELLYITNRFVKVKWLYATPGAH